MGDSEGAPEAEALMEALTRAEEEPLAEAEGATLAVALGVALPKLDSLRLARVECDCVADPVKVTSVGKAVMLTVGKPGCGEAVTVKLTLGRVGGRHRH